MHGKTSRVTVVVSLLDRTYKWSGPVELATISIRDSGVTGVLLAPLGMSPSKLRPKALPDSDGPEKLTQATSCRPINAVP